MLFKPLTLEEIEHIVDLQVDDVRRRLADRRMTLEITEPARALIAREGYDPVLAEASRLPCRLTRRLNLLHSDLLVEHDRLDHPLDVPRE